MTITAIPVMRSDDRFGGDPLTAAHRLELTRARDRAKSIRKAAAVAAFNGWSSAIVAALSAPFAFFSLSGLVLTVGFAIIAYNEFRGRKRLLSFNPSAATLLGWNQLGLLAMLVVYCLWTMYGSYNNTGAMTAELKGYADLDAALGTAGGFEGLYKQIVVWFYGGVIALSVLFQGGNALYYFTRRRHIEEFVAETPEWVRDVQRGTLPA